MAFDLHLSISESSPEGQNLQAIILRDRVTPEEAIRIVLRQPELVSKTPASRMIGAFSSDEDTAITDEAMKYVRAVREANHLRDYGI